MATVVVPTFLDTPSTVQAADLPPLAREQIEQVVHDYLMHEPEVLHQAAQIYERNRQRQAAAKADEIIAGRRAAILDPAAPSAGSADAKVTLVEFFDFRCGYCRRMLPRLLGITALIVTPDPVKIATEGAVWGSVKAHGLLPDTVILSDDAGQFALDRLLARLRASKDELLVVLERPEVPLHTNGSERDLRPQVIRRKISGGTRSETGRACRDAFLGLLLTCAKLGVSFWAYLGHRLGVLGTDAPYLPDLVRTRSAPA